MITAIMETVYAALRIEISTGREKVKTFPLHFQTGGQGVQRIGRHKLVQVKIEDLLPRDEIEVDMEKVGALLSGKKVLITGSAGSIGSEMVRQIAIYKPSEMMLIDQAETPQHDIRLMMKNEYPDITAHTVVTSICKEDLWGL